MFLAQGIHQARRVSIYVAAYLIALFILAPFIWVLITSVQNVNNLMTVPTKISLTDLNFSYYKQLFADPRFRLSLSNSLVIVLISTFCATIICSLGGYAMGTLRLRGKTVLLFIILGIILCPGLVFLIPLFMILRSLQLIDTYLGIALIFQIFQVPIGIWILRGFFNSIPTEIFEAAKIDGCSPFGVFLRIGLPLARPGIITVGLYAFLDSWNDLLVPLTVSIYKRTTLTVYAASFGGLKNMNYGGATAVAVLSAIPTIFLAILFRKQIIRGLTAGAVKG